MISASDTFVDATGRCYIAGAEVPRPAYDRHLELAAPGPEAKGGIARLPGGGKMMGPSDQLRLVDRAQLADAFDRWGQEYLAAPDTFGEARYDRTDAERCADYLLELLDKGTSTDR